MTPCDRGCCWSPYGCAKNRDCDCHWGGWLHTPTDRTTPTIRRPTEDQAIRNIEQADRKRRRKPK